MKKLIFITHANVDIDPAVPVPEWGLSGEGKRRHGVFNASASSNFDITRIVCSGEKKAIDGAKILSEHLRMDYAVIEALHENDRSSTGFLKPDEFEKVANEFFAYPDKSVRGWERASDAQKRIVSAIKSIMSSDTTTGDIAVIAHGGVGTLLRCHLLGEPISRDFDQPLNGGGNYFVVDLQSMRVLTGWKEIDEKIAI